MNISIKKNHLNDRLSNIIPLVAKLKDQPIERRKLLIKDNTAIHVLSIDDVTLIKAEGNYSVIYSIDGSRLMVSKTLLHYDHLLSKYQKFVRVHKSYLVNTEFIRSIVMSNEIKLEGFDGFVPLARSRRAEIMSLMERLCIC